MNELKAGQIVELTVLEELESRYTLTNGDEEIFLNKSEVIAPLKMGERVKVFLYTDRRGAILATIQLPTIEQGEYGWARVIKVDREGAYVDIGTSREVLVKGEDLPVIKELWPQVGDHLYVTLRVDRNGELFGRLITEEKVNELYEGAHEELHNQNVIARPYRLLPVGSFLLGVDSPYRIFIHNSEMNGEPRLGEQLQVRIIDVKEDGSLNGSLLPRKHERLSEDAEKIFDYLQSVGGKMPFGDKSTPEEIKEMFGMSKGAFKRALGTLMKANKVTQEDGWTEKL